MRVLVGVLAGVLLGWVSRRALRALLDAPVLARTNHGGVVIPTGAGLVLVAAAVGAAAAVALGGAAGVDVGPVEAHRAVLPVVVGFALLGLVDDLVGRGDDGRGFRGHLGALAGGRATTGVVKLVGGAALALAVCAPVSNGGALVLVADAALVALAANLANLFDRAPGRTLKVGATAFAVLAVATGLPPALAGVAVVVGAGLALLPGDLEERFMLGDTGANALGAVLGLGVVLASDPGPRLAVLAGVAVLNAAGEAVSFSRVIDAVPLLRAVDRAGRRRSQG